MACRDLASGFHERATLMGDTRSIDQTDSAPTPSSRRRNRAAYLIVLSGSRLGELHSLPDGKTLIIGRGESADVRLVDDGISRRHASIAASGLSAHVEDLGSHNGTWVDGQRISAPAHVQDGSRIQLGFGTLLKFAHVDEVEAEVQRKLASDAVREPLTGLYNRRHFEDRLTAAFAAARRHGRPVAVLLIDVDNFKQANDKHGHAAGDDILVRLGAMLQAELRSDDVIARIGGDEFAVLAETDEKGALRVADHLRTKVSEADLLRGSDPRITLSIGAAISIGKRATERGHGPEELMAAADRVLYEAKNAGRDRVMLEVLGSSA
jgi:diguanylate cyclase (GGDEF)-like protein